MLAVDFLSEDFEKKVCLFSFSYEGNCHTLMEYLLNMKNFLGNKKPSFLGCEYSFDDTRLSFGCYTRNISSITFLLKSDLLLFIIVSN
jgi:hypothetical protein